MKLKMAVVIIFILASCSSRSATSQNAEGSRSQDDEKHGSLLLTEFQIPAGARVTAFDLDLAGDFESISNIPPGWQVSIENNSAGQSHLTAHAKAAAQPLNEASFRNLGLQIAAKEFENERLKVSGYFTLLLTNGNSKQVPLNSYSFRFLEHYHRHRLSADAVQPWGNM